MRTGEWVEERRARCRLQPRLKNQAHLSRGRFSLTFVFFEIYRSSSHTGNWLLWRTGRVGHKPWTAEWWAAAKAPALLRAAPSSPGWQGAVGIISTVSLFSPREWANSLGSDLRRGEAIAQPVRALPAQAGAPETRRRSHHWPMFIVFNNRR